MGYDIRAWGTVTVKPENFDRLCSIIEQIYRDEDVNEATLEALPDKDLDTLIYHCPIVPWGDGGPLVILTGSNVTDHGPGLHFTWIDDDFRANPEEVFYFFEQIAECVEDGEFRFCGEDGREWKWVFANGDVQELEGQTVFVDGRFDAAKATEALRVIVGLLYPQGEVRNTWDQTTFWLVADVLREYGFGPLANKPLLDILAAESGAAK